MTRQWDDRQKEHELKAAVLADMGKDSAHALLGGEAIWSGQVPVPDKTKQTPTGTQWALAALEMESRLRTYFSPSVVRSFELYSWAVGSFISAGSTTASAELQDAVADGPVLDRGVAEAAAELIALGESAVGSAPMFGVDAHSTNSDRENFATLETKLSPELQRDRAAAPSFVAWTLLEKQLLALPHAVAEQVLHSHAEGFSTTGNDLLHDLMP